jgi:hypothetical protein
VLGYASDSRGAAGLSLLLLTATLATGPRVILLRGWFDSIADQLKALWIEAKVAGHLNWSNEVAEILRNRSVRQFVLRMIRTARLLQDRSFLSATRKGQTT